MINLGGARGPIRNGFHFRSNRCDKVKLSLEPRMNIRSVQIIQKISQSAIFFYLLLRETVRFCHRIISTCQIRLCSQVFKRLVLRCSFSSPLFFSHLEIFTFIYASLLTSFQILLHQMYLLIKIFHD